MITIFYRLTHRRLRRLDDGWICRIGRYCGGPPRRRRRHQHRGER